MNKPITPHRDLMCVLLDKPVEKIGSIFLPYYKVQPPDTGIVVSLGAKTDGDIKVGDRVRFDCFLGSPYEEGDDKYVLIQQDWVWGKLA